MNIMINGAMGRMGRAVIEEAMKQEGFKIMGLIESAESPFAGERLDQVLGSQYPGIEISDGWRDEFRHADVLIDFSLPDGTMKILDHLTGSQVSLVCGTTGFSEDQMKRLFETSKRIALFYAPNMSLGMYVMSCSLRLIARKLPKAWDVEIVETHHRNKKDSPSGTAINLAEVVSELSRPNIHSLRIGDVPGEHRAVFAGPGETIDVGHSVNSRSTFASGSLLAARFLEGKGPGLYAMDDLFS